MPLSDTSTPSYLDMKPKAKAFSIGKKYIRFVAVSCSHGKYADPTALDAVLKFKNKWNPELVIHLGDWCDTSALRGGASGTSDEAEPIAPDIDGGLQFLRELGATHALDGNHEHRIALAMKSQKAVVSYAASKAQDHIDEFFKKNGIRRFPYDGVFQRYLVGDVTFTHGTVFNENAARDMAEEYGGKVVFGHTHRAQCAEGRTIKESTGYCAGTLTKRGVQEYSKCRRATLAWRQGLVFGEIGENDSAVWLCTRSNYEVDWRLPL
jgi:predicted phosphodiesterase